MATLTYAGIRLQITWTNQFVCEARASEDGVDYLHTYWLFDVEAWLNPQATSYDALIRPVAGVASPRTHAAIRHLLMQPRQKLVYSIGADPQGSPVTLLSTPQDGYKTDAALGPFPKDFAVLDVYGDKTLKVRFRVEARVNECPGVNRPVMLSHRWRQYVDTDQDHFAVRATEGVVVFRSDELIKQNLSPDQFRISLGHTAPARMKRERVYVEELSQGTVLRYSFIDRDQPFNLVAAQRVQGLTRLEIYHTKWQRQESATELLQNAVLNGLGDITADPVGSVARALRTGAAAGLQLIPKYYENVFVRVWGDISSQRAALRALAWSAALGRLPGADLAIINAPAREISETHDVNGKFVELNVTLQWGSNLGTLGRMSAAQPFPNYDNLIGGDDGSIGLGKLTITDESATGYNPVFPRSAGTRGTNPVLLLTQALQGSCATPPDVPAPEYVA